MRTERWFRRVVPWLIFGAAMVLYLVTMAPTLVHSGTDNALLAAATGSRLLLQARDDSASMVVQAQGRGLFEPANFPAWYLLATGLRLIPFGDYAWWCNLSSALCAAAALVVFYKVVLDLVHDRKGEERLRATPPLYASHLPALITTLLLGSSFVFWDNALVASSGALNALLFLGVLGACISYYRTRNQRALFAIPLLTGIGAANFTPILMASPVIALLLLLVALGRKRRLGILLAFGGLFAAGFLVVFYLPVMSALWPPKPAPEYASPFEQVWKVAGYHSMVRRATIGFGSFSWIAVACFPLLYIYMRRKQAVDPVTRYIHIPVSVIIVFVGLALMMNAYLSFRTDFLNYMLRDPLPHLLIALWMAYGLGYLFVLWLNVRPQAVARTQGPRFAEFRKIACWAFLALPVVNVVLLWPRCAKGGQRTYAAFGKEILVALPEADLVFTNSVWADTALRYAAGKQGRVVPTTVVLDQLKQPWYRQGVLEALLGNASEEDLLDIYRSVPAALAERTVADLTAPEEPFMILVAQRGGELAFRARLVSPEDAEWTLSSADRFANVESRRFYEERLRDDPQARQSLLRIYLRDIREARPNPRRQPETEALLKLVLDEQDGLDPGNPMALLEKARLRLAQGRYDDSATLFKEVLPSIETYEIHNNLADALCLARQPKEALPHALRALELVDAQIASGTADATDPNLLGYRAIIQTTQGQIYCGLGRFDDAVSVLRDAQRVLPGHPTVLFYLGAALMQSSTADDKMRAEGLNLLEKSLSSGQLPEGEREEARRLLKGTHSPSGT